MTLNPLDQRVVDDVAEHGWHCLHVFSNDDEPSFSYSVGFWETLNAPELIVFGLGKQLMHSMLWEAFRQIRAGKAVEDGARWTDLIEGFDCVSRPVHPSQLAEYFGFALWYRHYRRALGELAAYQLFWPGKVDGLFPWESGCADVVRKCQPQLYLPKVAGIA